MILDITPIIEEANELDRIVLNTYDYDALYVARLANGKDYSVKFDKQRLNEFLPNTPVSQKLKEWEEGIKCRHAEATEALKTGLHPTRTFEREIIETIHGFEFKTREFETVRSKIDTYERGQFKRTVKDLKEQFGKITFVKIV